MSEITQEDLVKEFYINNPNREIPHQESVDWLTKEYEERTDKKFRDPDRAIRKLFQSGFLIKVRKGVYKYDPEHIISRVLEDFTDQQKKEIFKRDRYRCVICGRGKTEGIELHADHIKAKDFGGKAEITNGQTLCAEHNFKKKNYKQTETGKKIFIRLYEVAKLENDEKTINFCREILETFDKHDINGHIEWQMD